MGSLGAGVGRGGGEEQRKGVAVGGGGRGGVVLTREKAGLVVQLTASERENAILTEELAAFRSDSV